MSKTKKLVIVVASILVVIAIGLGVGFGVGLTDKSLDGPIEFQTNTLESGGGPVHRFGLVKSYEEWLDSPFFWCSDDYKYNKTYFRNKAMLVFTFGAGAPLYEFTVENVYIEDGVLCADIIGKEEPKIWQSSWSWRIIIEVKKSDIKGITEIKENLIMEDD